MGTKRDEADKVMIDELEQQGAIGAGSAGLKDAIQGEIVQPNKTGRRIEGLGETDDPTGGAGGP